jgi:glutathione synthase/RimK-type ligase-like ATP-grasp enzyme
LQFQQRIHGDNLRLYVIGGRVVAAGRILSNALDYREAEHGVERFEPEPALAKIAVTAAESVGLLFSGVDILAGQDRYVVLEANPSPMFAAFDHLAGTRVAEHLASFLVGM